MTRILYITRARLSFSRAHNQNIIKTAEYLNEMRDVSCIVFSSAGEQKSAQDIFNRKGVKNIFTLNISTRSRSIVQYLISNRNNFDVLYYRDPFMFYLALFARFMLRKKVVFEVHGSHEWAYRRIIWHIACATSNGLIFITAALERYYNSTKPSIVVHCRGVEPERFALPHSKDSLRKNLGLPVDKTIIMFAGSLMWSSINVIISMMDYLDDSCMLVIVGMKCDEINLLKKNTYITNANSRVLLIKRVLPINVPEYLFAADILVNPFTDMYPGGIASKLYEYLAAGKPIVSSKGGANDEILHNGKNALIVEPMTAKGFADAIMRILDDNILMSNLSEKARLSSSVYTWEKRAFAISEFIKSVLD